MWRCLRALIFSWTKRQSEVRALNRTSNHNLNLCRVRVIVIVEEQVHIADHFYQDSIRPRQRVNCVTNESSHLFWRDLLCARAFSAVISSSGLVLAKMINVHSARHGRIKQGCRKMDSREHASEKERKSEITETWGRHEGLLFSSTRQDSCISYSSSSVNGSEAVISMME